MLFGSQHFRGIRVCQSSRMGTRKINKQLNYSHGLAQTKQVGQCITGALLVHGQATGKHRLIRFTTAQIWGKPQPSPLSYTLCLARDQHPNVHFVPRLPNWSPEIPKIRTPVTLETHNFVCKPLIEMMYKKKLQLSSRAFQNHD